MLIIVHYNLRVSQIKVWHLQVPSQWKTYYDILFLDGKHNLNLTRAPDVKNKTYFSPWKNRITRRSITIAKIYWALTICLVLSRTLHAFRRHLILTRAPWKRQYYYYVLWIPSHTVNKWQSWQNTGSLTLTAIYFTILPHCQRTMPGAHPCFLSTQNPSIMLHGRQSGVFLW